jgi:hypothetical protein
MRWYAALSPLLLIACSSGYQIPQSHVQAPYTSIGAAEQQGVASVLGASERLDRAKQELNTANRMATTDNKRGADLMYLRADTDARVASALAQNSATSAETQRIQQEATRVQAEVRRCTPSAQQ